MPDYRRYCSVAGITGPEMIEAIREKFPKYSKSTNSMVNNPADYAVRLTEEAELQLVNRFGFAPGLDVKAPRNHDNKDKPHRLYVRVNAELRSRLDDLRGRLHFATDQDLIEAALWAFCDRHGALPPSPREVSANPTEGVSPASLASPRAGERCPEGAERGRPSRSRTFSRKGGAR